MADHGSKDLDTKGKGKMKGWLLAMKGAWKGKSKGGKGCGLPADPPKEDAEFSTPPAIPKDSDESKHVPPEKVPTPEVSEESKHAEEKEQRGAESEKQLQEKRDEERITRIFTSMDEKEFTKYFKQAKKHEGLPLYVRDELGLGSTLKEAKETYGYTFGAADKLDELINFEIWLCKLDRANPDRSESEPESPQPEPAKSPEPSPAAPTPVEETGGGGNGTPNMPVGEKPGDEVAPVGDTESLMNIFFEPVCFSNSRSLETLGVGAT